MPRTSCSGERESELRVVSERRHKQIADRLRDNVTQRVRRYRAEVLCAVTGDVQRLGDRKMARHHSCSTHLY